MRYKNHMKSGTKHKMIIKNKLNKQGTDED